MALAIAAANPHLNLVGVSIVHGNTSQLNATNNALRFLSAIGRTDIPVFPGAKQSLSGTTNYIPGVHGKTGLNGSPLLPQATFKAKSTSEFFPYLQKQIVEHEGKLCIAAIGPLTNMALFFRQYPESKQRIRYMSIMGGGFQFFNVGKSEFNVITDAIAADEILSDFDLADKILLSPLDLTLKTAATSEQRNRVLGAETENEATNFRAMLYQMMIFYFRGANISVSDPRLGPSVHDPTSIAALLYFTGVASQLEFKARKVYVRVAPETGEFVTDDDAETGLLFLHDMNVNKFWDLLIDTYDRIDKVAPMNKIDRKTLIAGNSNV
ncbi:unnamed protein product [Ambrosiozyma monospora]|uniref:Unnamed protein product n=1 Tax=Ambrosiozyma monospora TaxID=43982 RepID=A0A9W6YXK8_AMBMO|nr:unnamed protein product [Ambrosiozyma monospora]